MSAKSEVSQPLTQSQDHPSHQPPPSGQSSPVRRSIFNAALIVMICFVLSRVAGLVREAVIGAQFGTSGELDAYLAAFRVPDILFQLIAGGALGSAFIPTFAGYWAREDDPENREAWLLFSRVLNLMTIALVLLAAIFALFALPLVRTFIAPGFDLEQQLLTANLMRWMLLSTIVFGASGLIMGALNAMQHFMLPAIAPVLYNVAIILGAWLLAPYMGIYGLVAGVVIGACLHLFVQLPGLRMFNVQYHASFGLRDSGVREVGRLMGPRVLGLFFVQMQFLINTLLASGLETGSVSVLNFAWLLMLLPQGIFAQSIATASFPTFAAQVADGDYNAMRNTFNQTLRMVLFLTIPAAVGLFVLRIPLVQILFQRGAFTAESTNLVAYALQFYALGLIAHAGLEIVVRAFYALHDTMTPVLAGIGAMVLNILLSLLLINWLSFGGLALANSIATTLEVVVLLWILRGRLDGFGERLLSASVIRSAIAALGMYGTVWLWLFALKNGLLGLSLMNGDNRWIAALGGIGVAVITYLVLSLLLKSEELKPALAIVLRRRGSA